MSRVARASIPGAESEQRERARFELADAAARAERRNRPRSLLVGAVLLLLVCAAVLLWAVTARARAEADLRRERASADEFQKSAARYEQLRALAADKPGPVATTDDRTFSRIAAAAEHAGMSGEGGMTSPSLFPVPSVQQDARVPGAEGTGATRRSRYRYDNIRQASLETLIRWMNLVVEDNPGLEVYSIHLKPEANGWNLVSVVFSRWERVTP